MQQIEFVWTVSLGQIITIVSTSVLFLVLYAVTLLRQGGLLSRLAFLEAQIALLRRRIEAINGYRLDGEPE